MAKSSVVQHPFEVYYANTRNNARCGQFPKSFPPLSLSPSPPFFIPLFRMTAARVLLKASKHARYGDKGAASKEEEGKQMQCCFPVVGGCGKGNTELVL